MPNVDVLTSNRFRGDILLKFYKMLCLFKLFFLTTFNIKLNCNLFLKPFNKLSDSLTSSTVDHFVEMDYIKVQEVSFEYFFMK